MSDGWTSEVFAAEWVILWRPSVNNLSVEFRVGEVFGTKAGSMSVFYSAWDANGSIEPVENPEQAAIIVSGDIKWDGCSNWSWDNDVHFCSRASAASIGPLMGRMYDIAAANIRRWSGN